MGGASGMGSMGGTGGAGGMGGMGPDGYGEFLARIKFTIRLRQYDALKAVNRELVGLYWDLVEAIFRKQMEKGWGKSLVESLSRGLRAEFPGKNGFSAQNLWLMRQLYTEYKDKPNLQPLVGDVSWSKNLIIMGRCKRDEEREFYLRSTRRFAWTKAQLERCIAGKGFEQYRMDPGDFERAHALALDSRVAESLQDIYATEFLAAAPEAAA